MTQPAVVPGVTRIVRRVIPTQAIDVSRGALSFGTVMNALRWRKSMIFSWSLICLMLASAGLLMSRPRYTASAELMLGAPTVTPAVNSLTGMFADTAVVDSQIKTLESDHLARVVINKLGLWNDAELANGGSGFFSGVLGGADAGEASASTDSRRDTVLANFKRATSVSRSGRSYVVEVSFSALQPERASAVANALAAAYVEYQNGLQAEYAEQAGDRVENRITKLREKSAAVSEAADRLRNEAAQKKTDGNEVREKVKDLRTEAETYHSLSEALLSQYSNTVNDSASPRSDARVVSTAEPPSQWNDPRASLVLLLSAVGGGLIGAVFAVRREYTARPIRSPEQIEREVGVPALGVIPLVTGRQLHPAPSKAPPLLLHDRRDALRGIRIAANEISHRRDACVIGVVSACPGEGKSTVAFNLSVLEAESRSKVLLIDANLRRPTLARSLKRGALLASLEGKASLSESVARHELGFDFIGEHSADAPVHPAVLLGSSRMRELIRAARDRYDCIVCDLPNMLEHVDVRAAADIFDALVLVAEWGHTPANSAAKAVLKSDVIADRLVGVLINKAPRGLSGIA
jgi:succinoglycan biosynthesis transport protein ExoP